MPTTTPNRAESKPAAAKVQKRPNAKKTPPRDLSDWVQGKKSLGDALGLQKAELNGVLRLAVSLYKQEEYARALAMFEGLEALGFDLGPHVPLLASCYQIEKKNELAIAVYLRALRTAPDDLFLLTNLAELLLNRGRFPEARDLLAKAIKLDPEKKHPAGVRARALAVKGDRMAKGKR